MIMEHRFKIRSTPINIPLFLFALAVMISLIWGIAFRDPFINVWGSFPLVQAASTVLIVISLSVVLLTGNLVTDPKILNWMVVAFLVAGVLGLIDNFVAFIKLPVNTRGLFAMWIVAITSALAFFDQKLAGWKRVLLILLAFSWLYWGYGLNIGWLAGWVPLIAVLLMVGFFRSPKLAIVLIVLMVLVAAINFEYLSNAINWKTECSGTTRLAAWGMNWKITKDHLLFGTGPAGYAVYYMTYFPNQAMATHNNFLDMFAQTGIIGFSLMMWFFVSLVWMGWRLLLRLRGRRDFFEAMAAACLAGTLGGLMMMFFGDWLFPFAYTQTIAGFDYSVYNFLFMGVIFEPGSNDIPPSRRCRMRESGSLPKVSVLIINWNTRELLDECLTSVFETTTSLDFEVIVLDNASSDGSAEMVAEKFPSVKLMQNQENVGFSRGNNQAAESAGGEFFLLLNSDARLLPGALETLLTFATKTEKAAVIGAQLVNPDGSFQFSYADFPNLWREFLTLSTLGRRIFGKNYPSHRRRWNTARRWWITSMAHVF